MRRTSGNGVAEVLEPLGTEGISQTCVPPRVLASVENRCMKWVAR